MMDADLFKIFQCALSLREGGAHLAKVPLLLSSCEHSVCRLCFHKDRNELIECKLCDCYSEKKVVDHHESGLFLRELNANLNELSKIVLERTNKSVDGFLAKFGETLVDSHIEYIEQEIEIRIESLKIELDNLHEKFKLDVDCLERRMLSRQNQMFRKLECLRKSDACKNKLKKLTKMFKTNLQYGFTKSEKCFEKNQICELRILSKEDMSAEFIKNHGMGRFSSYTILDRGGSVRPPLSSLLVGGWGDWTFYVKKLPGFIDRQELDTALKHYDEPTSVEIDSIDFIAAMDTYLSISISLDLKFIRIHADMVAKLKEIGVNNMRHQELVELFEDKEVVDEDYSFKDDGSLEMKFMVREFKLIYNDGNAYIATMRRGENYIVAEMHTS